MDLMDTAALGTAFPTLSKAFHTDPVNLKFALTANLLTVAVLVPASGWLAGRFGTKRVFMSAMAIFLLGSVCCGLSNSVLELVIARILQGIGGSMMTPVGRSIVVASMPRSELVSAMALFTLPAILGPLAGPPLAGLILAFGSWRWIFLINVPVGIVALVSIYFVVPKITRPRLDSFDFPGFILLGISITSAMMLIETAGFQHQPIFLRLSAVVAVGLTFWIYWRHARHRTEPVIDLKLLHIDTLWISLLSSSLQRMPLGASAFLLPLLLQTALGFTALRASQVLLAMACGAVLIRVFTVPLLGHMGFRQALLVYGTLTSICSAIPIFFQAGTPMVVMMVIMAATGLFRSGFFLPAASLAYADIDEHNLGDVAVLFTVSQQLSISLGVSLAAWLLEVSAADGTLTRPCFTLPILVMAGFGGLSSLVAWPLRPDAGANMVVGGARGSRLR